MKKQVQRQQQLIQRQQQQLAGMEKERMVSLSEVFPLQEAQDFFRDLKSLRFKDERIVNISQGKPYQQADYEQLVEQQKAFDD